MGFAAVPAFEVEWREHVPVLDLNCGPRGAAGAISRGSAARRVPLPFAGMPIPFKTRFAPSPTGLLHLGNIRTALFNWLLARREQGVFLLRLEDTDAMRGHERFAEALQDDLRWLGFDWSEGPGVGGPHAPYAQSQRDDVYAGYFAALEQNGLAYPCFCSEHELSIARKTALAAGRPPRYSGKCRTLTPADVQARFAAGEPATLRFRVADGGTVEFDDRVRERQSFQTSDIGDFVIRRSDGTPAFFFCNAIDDSVMGVTLVVRGEDHLTNTPRQILLLQALGLPVPQYAHIALVVGADGAPLSKRTGSRSVQELRAAGYLPLAIDNYLARVGHTYESNALLDADSLARGFDVARLHRAPARYDEAQLRHWQREAVQHAATGTLVEWMGPETRNVVTSSLRAGFIEAVRGNITFPGDALHWAQIVFGDTLTLNHAAREAAAAAGAEFFGGAQHALERHGTDFKAVSATMKTTLGVGGKSLFQPLRAALTGELDGPEMAKLLPLIGVERARRRFQEFMK
jgi:nondiscriminating glutamyl-tRNA synthetase